MSLLLLLHDCVLLLVYHCMLATISPLLHVLASFSPVVEFVSLIINFLQQGATDFVPTAETKPKQYIFRKHGIQYSDIHDIKA